MKRRARTGWGVLGAAAVPIAVFASSSCVTTLSYKPGPPDGSVLDLAPPEETPNACGLVVEPATIAFGNVLVGKPVARSVSVKNATASPVTLKFGSSNSVFGVDLATGAKPVIAPGESTTLVITATATAAGDVSGTLTLGAVSDGDGGTEAGSGGACSVSLAVTARAVEQGRSFGPQPVDLGTARCGEAPGPRGLDITSVGQAADPFEASVVAPFNVTPSTGTLPSNGSLSLKIASEVLTGPAGRITRPLTLSIAGAPTNVDVTAIALGANLRFTPSELVFTMSSSQSLQIENTGNERVTVQLIAAGYTFGNTLGTVPLDAYPLPGAKKTLLVTGQQSAAGSTKVTIQATEGRVCAQEQLVFSR
ncbi:MAG: choice-of-anchor D domain-containing protein [Deltaproteobacteria bacterium]|nr:choice-of-anchor D domain-containing protein [Deltaproteobacteria bacterium]